MSQTLQIRDIVDRYQAATGATTYQAREVAVWADSNGVCGRNATISSSRCADAISRVLREEVLPNGVADQTCGTAQSSGCATDLMGRHAYRTTRTYGNGVPSAPRTNRGGLSPVGEGHRFLQRNITIRAHRSSYPSISRWLLTGGQKICPPQFTGDSLGSVFSGWRGMGGHGFGSSGVPQFSGCGCAVCSW